LPAVPLVQSTFTKFDVEGSMGVVEVNFWLDNGNGVFMAERRATCRYALFLAIPWLYFPISKRQNTTRWAFREKVHSCVFKKKLSVALGSEGTYVRIICVVRSFQDLIRMASHDTRPVDIQNSVRSRLRLQEACHHQTITYVRQKLQNHHLREIIFVMI
jgi:hypothetical protein